MKLKIKNSQLQKLIKEELSYKEEKELQIKMATEIVSKFNKQAAKSLIKLELLKDGNSFQFILDAGSDKFLDTKTYNGGGAIIYVSDAAYKLVESIAKKEGARNVGWNNTGSIGWI
jgi:hypothetical protein